MKIGDKSTVELPEIHENDIHIALMIIGEYIGDRDVIETPAEAFYLFNKKINLPSSYNMFNKPLLSLREDFGIMKNN